MQANATVVEREARHRLPALLAEILDDEHLELQPGDEGIDLVGVDDQGRHVFIQLKTSSRPGTVSHAAEQLRAYADRTENAIPLLVVPYMSAAGAETADRQRLNWLDLSGNARIRGHNLHVWVQGRRNQLRRRGRPSSPFAPKSARVTRVLLLEPRRWWRQRDLVDATGLDDGNVSRIVRRLDEELLLERRDRELRPRDPSLLLDAWAEDYRFGAHDILVGHISGSGLQVARSLADRLGALDIHHAFTGLAAAWAIDHFASFRLTTVYVEDDPRNAADQIELRRTTKGANVQIVGPNDAGVFAGEQLQSGLSCVATVQTYLDLLALPERAREAAEHLRSHHMPWPNDADA